MRRKPTRRVLEFLSSRKALPPDLARWWAVEVSPARQEALAMRWMIQYAGSRKGSAMTDDLAAEILDAPNNTGASVKKREDTHKMAQANRAFAHYRW